MKNEFNMETLLNLDHRSLFDSLFYVEYSTALILFNANLYIKVCGHIVNIKICNRNFLFGFNGAFKHLWSHRDSAILLM